MSFLELLLGQQTKQRARRPRIPTFQDYGKQAVKDRGQSAQERPSARGAAAGSGRAGPPELAREPRQTRAVVGLS